MLTSLAEVNSIPIVVLRPLVLIPAYQPGAALIKLVKELSVSKDIGGIIVVDDGSGPQYRPVFDVLENVHLLLHVVNLGKGFALKTGLNYAACQFPSSVGAVTADADGQHSAADILKVAATLEGSPRSVVIGARAFNENVPLRSRLGNRATRLVMQAVTGQKLTDTQSGLRGIPLLFVGDLMRLPANGYDFELDMLVACRDKGRKLVEMPIETIYIDGNRSSHFNPLRDSMRIYFVFVRFLAISLITTLIDNMVFAAAFHLLPTLWACQLTARLIAGTFNYFASRRRVFHSELNVRSTIPKYWLSVAISGGISFLLIRNLVAVLPIGVIPAKLCVETLMFFFSFVMQRDFVFAPKKQEEDPK